MSTSLPPTPPLPTAPEVVCAHCGLAKLPTCINRTIAVSHGSYVICSNLKLAEMLPLESEVDAGHAFGGS